MPHTTARFRRTALLVASVFVALLIYLGYYIFGPGGAISFGAFFGLAAFLAASLVCRWDTAAKRDRLMSVCAVMLAVSGGLYVAYVDYGWGFHLTRQKMRDANQLQTQFDADTRFRRISISYVDPARQKGEWLSVSGRVRSDADLAALHKLIDDDDKWFIKWDVAIVDARTGG
ncbi:hypothetical protein CA13_00110 [Planctomycetes bacterium CA13]|uniref:Uncharacterized protein n=2 Tax=Novipirellula herctigrandis TaxID=2527986 RepID=A0A5C5YUI3_9BACT|nr:hypothetical protein CA13_00110 [Planctomycetes bacterium CA13]